MRMSSLWFGIFVLVGLLWRVCRNRVDRCSMFVRLFIAKSVAVGIYFGYYGWWFALLECDGIAGGVLCRRLLFGCVFLLFVFVRVDWFFGRRGLFL